MHWFTPFHRDKGSAFKFGEIVSLAAAIAFGHSASAASLLVPTAEGLASARASVTHLVTAMDRFHTTLPVYEDVSSAGNHFHAFAFVPDAQARVSVDGSWTNNPHSGATSIRFEFRTGGQQFGGVFALNGVLRDGTTVPGLNFGEVHNAGLDVSGATQLVFWARGERGGEKIEFVVGGVGYEEGTKGVLPGVQPDSTKAVKKKFTLTQSWMPYTIGVTGRDLSYLLNGFGWVTNSDDNPSGAVFFVDDAHFVLNAAAQDQRLNLPRFIRSYDTLPVQSQPLPVGDFDLRFRNAAFTYDNALAILAFLADGRADSVQRAKLIGDAFIYAAHHDRAFSNAAVRSVYAAGDIALPPGWVVNGRAATTPGPGFYDAGAGVFRDLWTGGDDLGALDVGNNAWVMIAQLALYRRTAEARYLAHAIQLAEFVSSFRNDTGAFRGFLGGIASAEGATAARRQYASTEHNLDLFAAFTALFEATDNPRWSEAAAHAKQFVESMWDPRIGAFRTGTLNQTARNENIGQLPLDVQAWSVLAIPDTIVGHPEVLSAAERFHSATSRGIAGFDFNDDRDGVWLEGTGQMAVAYAATGRVESARLVQAALQRAQGTPNSGDMFGLTAAVNDVLTTGFSFYYYRRLHIGASAWNVFAQLSVNPFIDAESSTPPTTPGSETPLSPVLAKVVNSTSAKIDKQAAAAGSKASALLAKARGRLDKLVAKGANGDSIQEAIDKAIASGTTLMLKSDVGLQKTVSSAEAKLAKLELKDPTLTGEADQALMQIEAHLADVTLQLFEQFDAINNALNSYR